MKTLYLVIWAQVFDILRRRIHALLKNFKIMNSEADVLGLLIARYIQALYLVTKRSGASTTGDIAIILSNQSRQDRLLSRTHGQI